MPEICETTITIAGIARLKVLEAGTGEIVTVSGVASACREERGGIGDD